MWDDEFFLHEYFIAREGICLSDNILIYIVDDTDSIESVSW